MRQPQAKCAKIKSECEKSQIPAKSLNPTDLCIFTLHFLFHGHCMWAVTDLLGAPFFHTYVFFSTLDMRARTWTFTDGMRVAGSRGCGVYVISIVCQQRLKVSLHCAPLVSPSVPVPNWDDGL